MSSVIEVVIISEHGEQLSATRQTIDYGNEMQRVVVILSDPDAPQDEMDMTAREALNESFADQLSMVEGYDA